jgi:two-component system, LytTR family, response regulator
VLKDSKVYTCLIVDDDNLMRHILEHYIKQTPSLSLAASLNNGVDALEYILSHGNELDILFLDVEMPQMSGLQVLKTLPKRPTTILITSKRDFALDAFELEVADFILKPVEYTRFEKAVNKAIEAIQLVQKAEQQTDIFVKVNNKMVKIALDEILYIEALDDYILIHTDKQKHIVYSTMKAIDEKLGSDNLLRIHRSFIINLKHIEAIEDNSVIIRGHYIPVSKSHQDNFYSKIRKL